MKDQAIDLDEIIRKSLQCEMNKILVPPKEEMWEKIANEIYRQRTSRRRKRMKLAAGATLVLFCSFLAVSPGNEAKAFGQRFITLFENVLGEVNSTEMASRTEFDPGQNVPSGQTAPSGLTAPPTNQVPVVIIETPERKTFDTVEEARKATAFPLKEPKYIPEGYSLFKVTISGFEEEPEEIALYYKYKSKEIVIYENDMSGDFARSDNFKVEDAISRSVSVNGSKGTLRLFTTGYNELVCFSSGSFIRVWGCVEPEELLKIGKSL